ncbi:arginine/serine-rich protein PNISR isoform X2 [Pseudochaenichthys georgianus]|uniref:arginine/serine-rich protein PNISR isoform X2 n=1 Tax=Pseudochaenichthys georgianus TaxID=52239 RepID=UPI00146EB870|nr:arginine/serine-rich protein PNISR isoform X2 [Pseudochaenichthys georgianus]
MWDQGGQPWPQWPLSQQQWMQSFQHTQDPGQVDWAALAQAWIAQKETTGPEQPNILPNGQDIPGLEPVGPGNHGAFPGDPAFGRMWQPEWAMHGQPPPPPPPEQAWIPPGSGPMDVVNPSEDSNSQDSVEFNSEAHHGVYPQNSHGMAPPHPSPPHPQTSTPHTGRVLLRTDEMSDPPASGSAPDPPSSFLSNRRSQQH